MKKKNEIEVFNRYVPAQLILVEKYDKNIAARNFFLGFLDDFEFGVNDYYPGWTFWLTKDEKFLMCLNPKNRDLWVDYYSVWKKLMVDFGMNYAEIQVFIQHLLLQGIKLDHITPLPNMSLTAWFLNCYKV